MNKNSRYNPKNLPVIKRNIASAILITSDGKIVMGRKHPQAGGVYPDAWHIPGGGVEEGESLGDAANREVLEETGLSIADLERRALAQGGGSTTKTLKDGTQVWCDMVFNRFEMRLPQTSTQLEKLLKPNDDLVELRCFSRTELQNVEQIPGGKEFFQEMGYMD